MPTPFSLQARMPDPERVVNIGCSGIVERVEAGLLDEADYDDIFREKLGAFEGETVDAIVLGCTHFPFIAPAFRQYALSHFKGECRIFDGNLGTAKQLRRVLERGGLLAPRLKPPRITFLTSGDRDKLEPIFNKLMEVPLYE